MAYNPYDDLKQIYNSKVNYNKAKNANDTAGMQSAADSAMPYYQSLRDNGYSKYADDMSGYTETQAWEMINSMNPSKPPVQISFGNANNWQNQQTQPSQSVQVPQQTVTPMFTQPVAQPSANINGSIYQNITPDILDAVQGITDNKTLYDNSKFTLQDGNYQQYAELAIPYYDSLRAAGRSDIADYLSGSTTPAALEYLRSIGIELDPAQQDMNTTFNNLINQPSQGQNVGELWEQSKPIADYIMQSGQSASNPMTQGILNQLLSQPHQSLDMGQMWQDSKPIIDYITQLIKPDEMTQAASQQAVDNMNALFGQIMGNNQQIQQDSGKLNDLISQYMGEQTARYDDLYDWLKNTNYYDTDTAKNIMSYYNAQGGKAANGATADGMAQNSGNIDSYAAANALRQQLDFTNAGNQAVLNQYNAQAGNMLNTLKALGVDVGDAQDRMLGLLGSNQSYNADLLGKYNSGTSDVLSQITKNAQAGDAAAIDALNSLIGLYESGMANDTNRYLGQLETAGGLTESGMVNDTNRYLGRLGALQSLLGLTESNMTNDTNRYLGQLGAAGDILANRDTLESTERQLSAANANNLEMLNAELASNERISANELAQAMELAGINRELTLAELENAYRIASEGNASNERISANELAAALRQVEINAEVDKYVAGVNSSTNKYVADAQAAADRYAADAKAAADKYTADKGSTTGTTNEAPGFDALLYTFSNLRPEIKAENTSLSDEQVDEMAWREIGRELGWNETETKRYIEWYRELADDIYSKHEVTKDEQGSGNWFTNLFKK